MKKLALALCLAGAVQAAELPPMPPLPPTPVLFYGIDFLVGTELPDGSIAFMVPDGAPRMRMMVTTNFAELGMSTNLTKWSKAGYLQNAAGRLLVIDTTARGLPMRFYRTKPVEAATTITIEAENFTSATNHVVDNFDGSAYLSFPRTGVGQAVYEFTVVKAGRYVAWARVKSDSGAQDSFFLQIEGLASEDGTTDDIFDTGQNEVYPGTWELIKVVGRGGLDVPYGDPGVGQRVWNLSTGIHRLLIRSREANTELDKVIFTQDLQYPPE